MPRSLGQQEGPTAGFHTPLPTVLAAGDLGMPHAETYVDLSKTAFYIPNPFLDIISNFPALLKDKYVP